jgi:hypothetical protein
LIREDSALEIAAAQLIPITGGANNALVAGDPVRALTGSESFRAVVRRQMQSDGTPVSATPSVTNDATGFGHPTAANTRLSPLPGARVSSANQNAGVDGHQANQPLCEKMQGFIPAIPETWSAAKAQTFGSAKAAEVSSSGATEELGVEEGISGSPVRSEHVEAKDGFSGTAGSITTDNVVPSATVARDAERSSKLDSADKTSLVAGADSETADDARKLQDGSASRGTEMPSDPPSSSKVRDTHVESPLPTHRAFHAPWPPRLSATGKSAAPGIGQMNAIRPPAAATTGIPEKQNADDLVPSLILPSPTAIDTVEGSQAPLADAATGSTLRMSRISSLHGRGTAAGPGENSDPTISQSPDKPTEIDGKLDVSSQPAFASRSIRGEATVGHDAVFAKAGGSPNPGAPSVTLTARSFGSDLVPQGSLVGMQSVHAANGSLAAPTSTALHVSRITTNGTFERMDSASAPQVIESAPQRLAVGVHSTGLGWVEIRTSSTAGQVSATLASSAESHNAISSQLPTMREYLAGQQVQVDTLTSERFSSSSGNGSTPHQHSSNEYAQQAKGMERETAPTTTSIEVDTERLSYINVRV